MEAVPLTPSGFAEFGDVIEAPAEGRAVVSDALSLIGRPTVLSTTRAQPSKVPLRVEQLERHPHSSQTFLPLDVSRWVVVVGLRAEPLALRAFVAGPGVGVTIGQGVWHYGLTVLDRPAAFAVVMAKDGQTDDEWIDIDPIVIELST